MNGTLPDLVAVRREDKTFATVAFCSAVKDSCHIAFTPQCFAWRPQKRSWFASLFAPGEYHAVPWERIVAVEVDSGGPGFDKKIRVAWTGEEGETQAAQFSRIMYLRKWIKAFRRHGIRVAGAERFDLVTVRGFLREYGWTLWIASLSAGMFLLIELRRWSLIHLWFAVAEFVAAVLLWLVTRKGTR